MNNKKVLTLTLAGLMSSLALVGCNKGPSLAETVASKLTVDSIYKQPTAGFLVPNVVLHEGTKYNVTWSEESDFIEIGKWDENHSKVNITRPAKGEANANYDLVGTVTADGKTATKTFSGVIPAYLENPITYSKVTDLYADLKAETLKTGVEIEFTGVVADSNAVGLYVIGEDGEAVYKYGADESIKKGDAVKIVGPMATFASMYQFDKSSKVEVNSRGNQAELKAYKDTPVTVGEIYDLNPKLGDTIHGKTMKMTGLLSVEQDGEFVNYYLRDLNDASKKHEFYYKTVSDDLKAKLKAASGSKVTYNVIYYSNTDKKGTARLIYNDAETLPQGEVLTADQMAEMHLKAYEAPEYVGEKLTTTYKAFDGTEYTVSYNGVGEDGVQYVKADGSLATFKNTKKLATFDVTFTAGTLTKTLSYPNMVTAVGDVETVKFAKVMSDKAKDEVFVEGYVLGMPSFQDFMVYQDGKIYLARTASKDLNSKIAIGKHVYFAGKYNAYNGVNQFKITSVLKTVDEKAPELDYASAKAVDLTGLADAIKAGIKAEDAYKPENAVGKILANEWTLVKLEGKMGSQYTEFEGCQINTNKDDIAAAKIKEGDNIVSYAIIAGAKTKSGKVEKIQGYCIKIEKAAEAPAA